MYPLSSSLATETRQRCWGTQAKQNISMKAFHFNCLNSFMPKMIPWDSNMCLQGDESRPLQPVVGREQRSDYKGLPWLPREPRGPSEPGRASQVGKVCLCNTPATWNNFTLLFSKPQQIAFKNVEGKKKMLNTANLPKLFRSGPPNFMAEVTLTECSTYQSSSSYLCHNRYRQGGTDEVVKQSSPVILTYCTHTQAHSLPIQTAEQ